MIRNEIDASVYANVALAALEAFELANRGSGRTTRMIESAKPGDTIVAWNKMHARAIQSAVKDKHGNADINVVYPRHHLEDIKDTIWGRKGQILYDHHTVYLHLRQMVKNGDYQLAEFRWIYSMPLPVNEPAVE